MNGKKYFIYLEIIILIFWIILAMCTPLSLLIWCQAVHVCLSSLDRQTSLTVTSATLIDNIFANNLMDISHSLPGLLITDVSDHFPICHVSRRMQMSDVDVHIYKRSLSLKKKQPRSYHAVNTTNWDEIGRASDNQQAFDLFHNQVTEIHDEVR